MILIFSLRPFEADSFLHSNRPITPHSSHRTSSPRRSVSISNLAMSTSVATRAIPTSPVSDMADLPAPAPAPAPTPAAAARPKFRDSCNSCSGSKVKCSREKPACARCVKRGITCEYVVTKRAGRRKQTQNVRPTPSSTPPFFFVPPPSMQSTYSGVLHDTSISPSYSFSGPILDTADFENVLSSPVDVSALDFGCGLDFVNVEQATQSHLYSPDMEVEGNTENLFDFSRDTTFSYSACGENDDFTDSMAFTMPQSPPDSKASSTSGRSSACDFSPHEACIMSSVAKSNCLERALSLLRQLSPQALSPGSRPMRRGGQQKNGDSITVAGTDPTPTLQAVIVANEQTTEVISNILECPCSKDAYLLMIMSIVVFRMLGWYEIAARGTLTAAEGGCPSPGLGSGSSTPSEEQPSPWSSATTFQVKPSLQQKHAVKRFCIEEEEENSMAGQMVLRELHRVQRLINELSRHLKVKSAAVRSLTRQRQRGDDGRGGGVGNMEYLVNSLLDSERWSPFSSDMLDHMEEDLRKRLRSLSLEIVDMLRQY